MIDQREEVRDVKKGQIIGSILNQKTLSPRSGNSDQNNDTIAASPSPPLPNNTHKKTCNTSITIKKKTILEMAVVGMALYLAKEFPAQSKDIFEASLDALKGLNGIKNTPTKNKKVLSG